MKLIISAKQRTTRIAFLAIVTCSFHSLAGAAQVNTASLTGVITDTNGAVVRGASVSVVNVATNVSQSTTSDESGLPDLIAQDESFDIVGGAAGCIAGLCALYAVAPAASVLAAAVQCGDRLLANALKMEQGIGWLTPAPARKPPSGFSHGAAGIAWSLLKLYERCGAMRFRAAALAALAYERSLFSPEQGNWLDQRELGSFGRARDGQRKSINAWCYGAPGIGLARLNTLAQLNDDATQAEIKVALRTTLARGFGQNHSLCHGDLGNIEFLAAAAETFDDAELRVQVRHLTASILASIAHNGWLCGLPLGVESPGLMTGLAGIGYGLLRLAAPADVPLVLMLAPPAMT